MERTISYEEHYVQVGFYQSIIKLKEKEVNDLRNQLKLSNDLLIKSKGIIETVKAKLEVSQQNRITICPRVLTSAFNNTPSTHIKHDLRIISHFTVVILHEFGHIMDNKELLDKELYYGLNDEEKASLWAQEYLNKYCT